MQNYNVRWWGVRAIFELTETILCSLLEIHLLSTIRKKNLDFFKTLLVV